MVLQCELSKETLQIHPYHQEGLDDLHYWLPIVHKLNIRTETAFSNIAKMIRQERFDIIALQEVVRDYPIEQIKSRLGPFVEGYIPVYNGTPRKSIANKDIKTFFDHNTVLHIDGNLHPQI